MDSVVIFLITGAVAGILAGLLGVGGGLIIVPALALYFSHSQLAVAYVMHLAIGTSLATIVITGLSSTLAHQRHGAVDWVLVMKLAPGLIIGALSGAVLADHLATASLRRLFGVFELAVAVQLGFGIRPAAHRTVPGRTGLGFAGWVIGVASSLMGIGGGTLTVPFLLWCGVLMRQAVAASAACGPPIAIAGALGFAVEGWNVPGLPAASTGYIYWPAFIGITAASVLSAPLGARWAHTVPSNQLRLMFAGFLVLVGLRMLFG